MYTLPSRRAQRGYLLEVPIILIALVVVASIVLPNLPPIGQKIFLVILAVPVLFGLFYMIVIPGLTPDNRGRLRPPWNLIVFGIVAALIVAVLVLILVSG